MAEREKRLTQEYLNRKQAAARYGLSESWFEKKAVTGDGPPMVRISARCVRYRLSDLEHYMERRLVRSTADPGSEAA